MGKNRNWFAFISVLLLVVIANCSYADGLLYAVQDSLNPGFFWIDPSDGSYGGVAQLVGTGYLNGLAYNSADGLLYAVQDSLNPGLFWIDPSDGSYGGVAQLVGTGYLSGLAYNSADGLLYAVQDSLNPGFFWIDPSDGSYGGVAQLVGTGYLSGLAYVPEPATLGLLLLGGLILVKRRRLGADR